jgi:hypothetical protein
LKISILRIAVSPVSKSRMKQNSGIMVSCQYASLWLVFL